MLKNKKAIISILLCVVIIASMLTACGGSKNTSDSQTGEKSTAQTSTQVKEPPMKLHLLGHDTGNKFIKFDERDKYPVWKEIQKLFDAANLELEYELVPTEQYEITVKTKMASGSDLPDIVNLSPLDNTTVLNFAKQGIIVDLNELIDKYSNGNIKNMYTVEFPYAKQLTTSDDGKMYWFSDLHKKTYKGTLPAPVALSMLIRQDWLKQLNIPAPTTAQEYAAALKAMRDKDANGNKQPDEILIYDPSSFSAPLAQWFGLGSDITAVDVENKKIVSPWYQPGIKDYFKFLQQLVKDGVLDTSLIGGTYEQRQQKLAENKVASLQGYNLSTSYEKVINNNAELLPLMPLKGVDGIQPAAQLEPSFLVWQKYSVTKDCKNPKAAIAFFDVIYSKEFAELSYWGIEGLTYKKETADGNTYNVYTSSASDEELAKTGNVIGNKIFADTVFPRIQLANLEYELSPEKGTPQYKVDHEMQIMNYKPYFVNMNNIYEAMPNDTQVESKTKILNNLTTYSKELATKLALGQKSLDDWDKYMADLKNLGLDELIKIDQELLDRYNSLASK